MNGETHEQQTARLKAEAEMLAAMSPHERQLAMRSLAARTCAVGCHPRVREFTDVKVRHTVDQHGSGLNWSVHMWSARCGFVSLPFFTEAFALRVADYVRENDKLPGWATTEEP